MKKQFLALMIMFLLIFILTGCDFGNLKPSDTVDFKDHHSTFKISAPTSISLVSYKDTTDEEVSDMYLYSETEDIYVLGSVYENYTETSFLEDVEEDRLVFVEGFEYTDLSTVTKLTIKDYEAYTYNFVYKDNDEINFFRQVIWIKGNNYTYILDLEVPIDTFDVHEDTLNKIAESFTEL